MNIPAEEGTDQQERAILRVWEYLQQSLLTFALSPAPASNRRLLIEDLIIDATGGCAQLWWAPYTNAHIAKNSQLFEVRYQHIRCYPYVSNYGSGVCDIGAENDPGALTLVRFNIDCGNGTGPCPGWSCFVDMGKPHPDWVKTVIEEDVNTTWAGWLGPANYAFYWKNNRYRDPGSTTWKYRVDPVACPGEDGCPSYHNGAPPPEMYWNIYPHSSSTGGVLFSCERSDGYPTC